MATDGTGVTALVAAQGCPLDCRYCINQPSKTFGCEKNLTLAELYDRVKKDGLYYSATGGGVTFGGGEPLLHADFIAEFRGIIPAEWHIYAETSLYVPADRVRTAARAVDHFFVDIKDTDPSVYRAYTGGDVNKALDNLKLLLSLAGAGRITVRLPLIPGFNTEDGRKRSAAYLESVGVTDIDLFDYKIPEN